MLSILYICWENVKRIFMVIISVFYEVLFYYKVFGPHKFVCVTRKDKKIINKKVDKEAEKIISELIFDSKNTTVKILVFFLGNIFSWFKCFVTQFEDYLNNGHSSVSGGSVWGSPQLGYKLTNQTAQENFVFQPSK